MQLLCSCHIAAPSRIGSLCSLCTFALGIWETQWDLGEISVLATTILHWTFCSVSKPSCSGGLTNPAGKGEGCIPGPAGCALTNTAQNGHAWVYFKGVLLAQIVPAVCQGHQVHIILFFIIAVCLIFLVHCRAFLASSICSFFTGFLIEHLSTPSAPSS